MKVYVLCLLLFFSGCSKNFEMIDTSCNEIHVEVYGDINEELVLPCEATFEMVLNKLNINDEIDYSMYNLHMPLYEGDRIELRAKKEDKISINTGGIEELVRLKGIGEVIAGRIIEYREVNGLFTSLEEIMNVRGIGEKKFAAIKEHICL